MKIYVMAKGTSWSCLGKAFVQGVLWNNLFGQLEPLNQHNHRDCSDGCPIVRSSS